MEKGAKLRMRLFARYVALLATLTIAGSLFVLPGAACADEGAHEAAASDELTTSGAVSWTPSGIDLRDRGVVTPVKMQNPWSTCWSFGTIAAIETSILSDAGTTYEETGLDLSEKHLLYFAMNPITADDDEAQAGEGMTAFGAKGNPNAAYISTEPIIATTLLATGVGPLPESEYPYQGKKGLTEFQYLRTHKDEAIAELAKESESEGIPYSESLIEAMYQKRLKSLKDADNYSDSDDWSLPSSDRCLSAGYTLVNGNTLPQFARRASTDRSSRWLGINDEGTKAVKSELEKGHGVAAVFCADTANPGDAAAAKYINTDTWAHYTYDGGEANHMICIVGYDDNYPKENFLSGVDKLGTSKTPPADGAWIAKNSWGSETDYTLNENGRPIGKAAWGLTDEEGKRTGYFYISYYDKSLADPESFEFAEDLNNDYFQVYQHDYMSSVDSFYFDESPRELSVANVYESDEDEKLTSIGTQTFKEGATVHLAVYRLNENAQSPRDGTLLAEQNAECQYAGFHRIALDDAVTLKKGDRFSVVATTQATDKQGKVVYGISANMTIGKQAAKKAGKGYYGTAVVNEGESFLYENGKWVDWKDYKTSDTFVAMLQKNDMAGYEIDNFTLKAYTLPYSAPDTAVDPVVAEKEKKASAGAAAKPTGTSAAAGKAASTQSRAAVKTGDNPALVLGIAGLAAISACVVGIALTRRRSRDGD